MKYYKEESKGFDVKFLQENRRFAKKRWIFNCHGHILCAVMRLAQVLTPFISRSLDAWSVAPKACSVVIHFRTFHAANTSQQFKPRV